MVERQNSTFLSRKVEKHKNNWRSRVFGKKSKATACIDCRDEAHAIML